MTAATFYTGVKNQNRFLRRWLEADVLARGENAIIYTGDDERANELDLFLWTANESDFCRTLCANRNGPRKRRLFSPPRLRPTI